MIYLNFKKIQYILLLIIVYFCHCTTTKTSTTGKYVPPPEAKEEITVEKEPEPTPSVEKVDYQPTREDIEYTVQVYAANDKEISDEEAEKILFKLAQPADVVFLDDMWKVRVGKFKERREAEIFRDKLKTMGWEDAFIVTVEGIGPLKETEKSAEYFSIQVRASGNREEARRLVKNLIDLNFKDSFIVFEDNLWKVRVGRFSERFSAERCSEKLKTIGFADCWIVISNEQ